jgi:hypothetical protein
VTVTRATTSLWLDTDNKYQEAAINEPCNIGSRYIGPSDTSRYATDGSELSSAVGILASKAFTNKCECLGTIPDNELQAELITVADDRTFDSDTGFWTRTNSTIGSGVLTIDAISGSIIRSNFLTFGKVYVIGFTMGGYTSGNAGLAASTTSDAARNVNANGVHELTILHDGSTPGEIKFRSAVAGVTFDDISVKELKYAATTRIPYDAVGATWATYLANIPGISLVDGTNTDGYLEIADATSEIAASQYSGQISNGKILKTNLGAGAGTFGYEFVGDAGGTTATSLDISAYGDIDFKMEFTGAASSATKSPTSSIVRYLSENQTPAIATNKFRVAFAASGGAVSVLYPGMFTSAYAPNAPIEATTSGATVQNEQHLNVPSPNMPTKGFRLKCSSTPWVAGTAMINAEAILFGTDDSGGTNDEMRTIGAGSYGYTHYTGGGQFEILKSDLVLDTTAEWVFEARQEGSNVRAIITLDGVEKYNDVTAGTLNHSDTQTVDGAYYNGTTAPISISEIEVIHR